MNNRFIPLEGGWNFRDIGGYPTLNGGHTRPGLIYRSGSLHHLTEADRQTLQGLGIRTAFDMRQDYEHKSEGPDQVGDSITVIQMPTSIGDTAIRDKVISDPNGFRMRDFYVSALAPRAEYHANLFRQIVVNLDHPLVIHCSAGKDRTGIVIALLLRVAGVDDHTIVTDYTETARHLIGYSTKQAERFRGFGMPENVVREMLACPGINIRAMLDHLDATFGSAENYLIQGGASPEDIERFRLVFIDQG
jgi:protein-tyrosine phosphatase